MFNKILLKIKIKILSIQWIKNLLQNTYFLRKYKKTVLNTIMPQLENFGIFKKIINSQASNTKIFVPYIETSYGKIFLLILILKALQIRGANIFMLICGKGIPICERFSLKNPVGNCDFCSFINKKLIPKLGFNVIEINDCISESEKNEINKIAIKIANQNLSKYFFHHVDIMPIVNDSLLRHNYGGRNTNFDIKIKYITTALIATRVAYNINKKYKPNIVVSHMYAYSEFMPYNVYFENLDNVPVFCLKGSAWKPDSININSMDLFKNENRYNQYLKYRNNKNLSSVELKQLYDYLDERFSGLNYEFTSNSFFNNSEEDKNIRNLKINQNKKNIFLFSNVEWDVGLADCNIVFKDIMSWVFFTIDSIKGRDDIHLYIKTHPSESYGVKSLLTVANKIHNKYSKLPNNVTLITPDYKIKPYSLFKYIDVGVVLFGTLGLEMSLKGIPVISTGLSPYGRKGFVHEPINREEYLKMLLAKDNSIKFDKKKLELFTYFYFIKSLIPFNLAKRYYGFNIENLEYNLKSLKDLYEGNDKHLDHICDCILKNKIIEAW